MIKALKLDSWMPIFLEYIPWKEKYFFSLNSHLNAQSLSNSLNGTGQFHWTCPLSFICVSTPFLLASLGHCQSTTDWVACTMEIHSCMVLEAGVLDQAVSRSMPSEGGEAEAAGLSPTGCWRSEVTPGTTWLRCVTLNSASTFMFSVSLSVSKFPLCKDTSPAGLGAWSNYNFILMNYFYNSPICNKATFWGTRVRTSTHECTGRRGCNSTHHLSRLYVSNKAFPRGSRRQVFPWWKRRL